MCPAAGLASNPYTAEEGDEEVGLAPASAASASARPTAAAGSKRSELPDSLVLQSGARLPVSPWLPPEGPSTSGGAANPPGKKGILKKDSKFPEESRSRGDSESVMKRSVVERTPEPPVPPQAPAPAPEAASAPAPAAPAALEAREIQALVDAFWKGTDLTTVRRAQAKAAGQQPRPKRSQRARYGAVGKEAEVLLTEELEEAQVREERVWSIPGLSHSVRDSRCLFGSKAADGCLVFSGGAGD